MKRVGYLSKDVIKREEKEGGLLDRLKQGRYLSFIDIQ